MAALKSASGVGDPVAHESRVRMRQAVIAAAAGICLLGASVVQAVGPQPKVSELTVELIVTNKRVGLELAGAVINALGLLGLGFTLAFLSSAARARRPASSPATRITAIAGGVLAAVGGVAYAIVISTKAHDFVSQGSQTYLQANHLVGTGAVAALQYAGLIGSLLLAVSFVLVAMNAMRVGLLTKFLGYLGMVAAAASLFLIGSAPALLVEVFWLMGVAYLLAGRWPGGDPPAWKTGQAEPWPTAAELREQRQQTAGKGSRSQAKPQKAQPVVSTTATTRSNTPKRKRKRRR